VLWLDAVAGDDNFYGGVSASTAYGTGVEAPQPADAISAEEHAAREQEWRAELAKVSFCTKGSVATDRTV